MLHLHISRKEYQMRILRDVTVQVIMPMKKEQPQDKFELIYTDLLNLHISLNRKARASCNM